MTSSPLSIAGAFQFDALTFPDERGNFVLWFEQEVFVERVGHRFDISKTHHAVSTKGTIRGIHLTALPPGQRKFVYCAYGRVLDVLVDLREGSPTFGNIATVVLDDVKFRSVYIPEGVGHGYAALADDSVVVYLCSTPYAEDREIAIDPLDPKLSINWPIRSEDMILSARDRDAPDLATVRESGVLPTYVDCETHRLALSRGSDADPANL